jgi:hypothetical protein
MKLAALEAHAGASRGRRVRNLFLEDGSANYISRGQRSRAVGMTVSDILGRLERVRKSGTGWVARCPAHDDRDPSLSISEGDDGRILMNCFASCTVESICAALHINVSGLFSENRNGPAHPPKGKSAERPRFEGTEADVDRMQVDLARSRQVQDYIESRGVSLRVAADLKWGAATWRFPDPQGQWVEKLAVTFLHYVSGKLVGIKFKTIDGTKLFSQMPGSSTDGLYALGQLDPNADDVLILEGPEDAALAISCGFNAVAINDAGAKVLGSDVASLCRHQRLFLVGDQDVAGKRAMGALEQRLPVEQRIRVRLPGYKDIGDLWKADPAQFPENLKRILRFARASRVHFQFEDLLTESEIGPAGNTERYAVDRLIPLRDITMFFSEEKGGKSLLVTYILKCAANGVPVFGKYTTRKMPVVVLDLEASDADIAGYLSHFSRLGSEQIRYFTRKTGVPALDSEALLHLCERIRPLLLLESLTKFVSATGKDQSMFDPADMSRFFDKVLNLCAAGATALITHHATRADAERYADSHQIGAAVARAYALVSLDRPRLCRLRLEGKLSRGAEPITEDLIGFPVIAERGEFGLSAETDPFAHELEELRAFVKSEPGESCFKETIKKRRGMSAKRNRALLDLALKRGILIVREDRKVAFPNSRTPDSTVTAFPTSGTDGNAT